MADHHYVPQFILRKYLYDASKKTPGKPDPQPQMVVKVLDKRHSCQRNKAIRTILCVKDANRLDLPPHPVSRALIYLTQDRVMGGAREVNTYDEFVALGESNQQYDPYLVERKLTEVDSAMASLAERLRHDRSPLGDEEKDILVGSALHARTRGPTWRKHYATWAEERGALHMQELPTLEPDLRKRGYTEEEVLRPIVPFFRMLRLLNPLQEARRNRGKGLKVSVLHARGGVGFVTCDNSGRPFIRKKLTTVFDERLPGYNDEGVAQFHPLGPDMCVYVSAHDHFPDGGHVDVDPPLTRWINTALLIAAQETVVLPPVSYGPFEPWAIQMFQAGKLQKLRRP